ncbi:chemotaxis response regulator protein-glutamate methylesterase [Cereibacter azotoformans]|uniref:Protein-glutamate methylesterase/protein-glutamine glutaminase n=1 Tax=Cereibacter azotoformans TaxID=43057 RepID=A0A2T5KDD7_9RHOB|nr:chemotaxis response regulator protein-glutamate methylesterase [Cereibacter azotoformans]AXQ93656.1 chemotaxis response regulator protein-glutamate methylesterase [Cereibacter sphaeroides]MBO4168569.1 chemotaxis response regulator protein-glutamate methylesterase [Cereibacter azotoformans]PTR20441.1 two-component system chemotaxis response regulator CheB [Cereibacter azotoformans]UIJ31999.1 chemotaxis response regulator protein-glutamate methylesterase [Cereibacter azotoformans]
MRERGWGAVPVREREGATRVLIVDDSAMVRQVLSQGLATDPRLEVVGTASSAAAARERMAELKPDVVTLDLEMPQMDGLTFLRSYMADAPVPTVVISSLTRASGEVVMRAMEAGAVDIISKPSLGVGEGLPSIMRDICARVWAAARARPTLPSGAVPPSMPPEASDDWIHVIGASTGGVQALSRILPFFPARSPGVVIVQHMPMGFTAPFARRLDAICRMRVREAADGDLVLPGLVLIAPGGLRHMELERADRGYRVRLVPGDPVCYSRPSVDRLFTSVAGVAGQAVSAALLTGMGRDGAAGLLAIRRAGGRTFAQDEASSVVYGMPLAARDLNAADEIVTLDDIPARMMLACAAAARSPATAACAPRLTTEREETATWPRI